MYEFLSPVEMDHDDDQHVSCECVEPFLDGLDSQLLPVNQGEPGPLAALGPFLVLQLERGGLGMIDRIGE